MRYEKIIVQPDGSKIQIRVDFHDSNYNENQTYRVSLMKCDKGKRTWYQPYDTDSHIYRGYTMPDRIKYEEVQVVQILGKEGYNAALKECWEKLEPKYI